MVYEDTPFCRESYADSMYGGISYLYNIILILPF